MLVLVSHVYAGGTLGGEIFLKEGILPQAEA